MKINTINRLPQIADQTVSKQLVLKLGQLINVQVLKSEGHQVLIQYGNCLFKAQSDLPLKRGERLKLVVEAGKDEIINLRIIDPPGVRAMADTPPLPPGSLSEFGLDTLVEYLIKFNLPVSQELIEEVRRFLKQNHLSEDMAQLLLWLKSLGIKVETQQDIRALLALQKYFQGLMPSEQAGFLPLINQSENQNMAGTNLYLWAIGPHQVYLIKSGSKREPLMPEKCKLAIKMDSQALEELWFVMELVDQNKLMVDIICSREKYRSILEKEGDFLKEALTKAGYPRNNMTVKAKDSTKIFDLFPEQEIRNVNLQV